MTTPAFIRHPQPMTGAEDPALVRVTSLGRMPSWRLGLLHDRPENVLIWVTRGQGRVVVNGIRRGFGTHNAMFIPAGTLFSVDASAQCLGLVVTSPAGLTGRLPGSALHLRARDTRAQSELTAQIEAMQREFTKGRIMLQDALEAHVRLIAVWLHRQAAEGTADAPEESAAQRLARTFARLLTRHYASDRSVAGYAEALSVTPTHLTRACRVACGRTAAEMIAERKLHAARQMLAEGEAPVMRVAEMLGFQSAAYFTRFIRSHTGSSPTDLRRAAGNGLAG
ncbi:helix-turn-helix domain-containing protein [Salipiger mucosus]|uniref:Transcriptional regulator, AraC family n=1 Tax=Salipiger mucosus DSM 16094 TaxID=1123237 RepID=S9QE15_9RHOB|nr:AraC family transcriptional regulator [Salipiger mucosus]EPX78142.1 Transcriptional regulator, AraC family [Salipiger mucosus DSM 16094]